MASSALEHSGAFGSFYVSDSFQFKVISTIIALNRDTPGFLSHLRRPETWTSIMAEVLYKLAEENDNF